MLQAFIRDFWSVGSPGWAIVAGSAVKPDNENAKKKYRRAKTGNLNCAGVERFVLHICETACSSTKALLYFFCTSLVLVLFHQQRACTREKLSEVAAPVGQLPALR
jgi:hypothetical protein